MSSPVWLKSLQYKLQLFCFRKLVVYYMELTVYNTWLEMYSFIRLTQQILHSENTSLSNQPALPTGHPSSKCSSTTLSVSLLAAKYL